MTYKNKVSAILTAVVALLLVVMACDNSTEPEESPFVGTWNLTNLNQDITLKTADDYSETLGFPAGFTIVDTDITWSDFEAMGVQGTITLKADSSFTLSGSLPIPNDTLGMPPTIQSIPADQGTWSVYAQQDSFELDGIFFDRKGELTLNDPENPTMISLVYAITDTHSVILPTETMSYADISVYDSTVTEIAFTKQ